MRIVSWNVNGIRSVHRKGDFATMLETLKPDVICLQETKAEQHQSEVDLLEYEEYWNSSRGKKGYAGTAIFTKQKPLAVLFDFPEDIVARYHIGDDGYGNPNAEGRVVVVELTDFFVANVYTPNSKDDLSRLSLRHTQWDPAFLAYMKRLEDKKPVIFCGDLNVAHTPDDIAHPKENDGKHGYTKEERSGIDVLIASGFSDTFRLFTKGGGHYTWWSHWANARARNVGWRLDYIFVSAVLCARVTHAHIHQDVYGSDHCPVSIDVTL